MTVHGESTGGGPLDISISYSRADERWAIWIANVLEDAGYRTMLQVWDFVPGSKFIEFIDRGISESTLVLAVLSRNYLQSRYGRIEWPEQARELLLQWIQEALDGRAKEGGGRSSWPPPTMTTRSASGCTRPAPSGGACLATLVGHEDRVYSVGYNADGSQLVSASWDGTVRLWDLSDLDRPALRLTLLGTDQGWAALAPDGRYKLEGVLANGFWLAVGICRFEPGELDDHLTQAVRRLPVEAPF